MTLLKVNSQPARKSFSGLMDEIFNSNDSISKWLKEDVFNGEPWKAFPPVNIHETKDAYLLDLAAPGLEKADFKISIDKDILTIAADKKEEKSTEDEKHIRREFNHESFKRSFTLDDAVDKEKISAKYENGILSLMLPKKAADTSANKEITVE
jgi:HSP20 family protein